MCIRDSLRNNSFLVELIQGRCLPACTVLVTSRPSATADLHFTCKSRIQKHIEILGFTHECIRQYAESMLTDQPDVLEDFLKYISRNPAIHGMMYIPLNSAIVLEIYKANRTTGKPVPHTLTQLYTELCLVLLKKCLVEKRVPLADQISIHSKLEDIPQIIKDQFIKLGKLAFDGALRQELTFEQLPDGCDDLREFMNVSTELYLGRKSTYSFLHLTLQEFLAAFYISQLPGVEQKLMFIETNNLLDRKVSLGCSNHLDVLWRFMAGLTGFRDIGWELVGKCTFIYSENSSESSLFLVQLSFEVHCEKKIKTACDTICKKGPHGLPNNHILTRNKRPCECFYIGARTPFDCYAVGYCVAASGHVWSLLAGHIGGNEIIEMLSCGLWSVGDVWGCFNMLGFSRNSLTHQAIIYLSGFPSKILNQISILDLSCNQLNKDALNCLADIFPHMVNLTSLDISNNPGGHGGMVEVFQKLHTSKVHTLSVFEINLGPSDIQALSRLIQPAANLKELLIGDIEMSSECVTLMIETVFSPSSLEKVELWEIDCTTEFASKMKLLENNSNLTSLKFINCLELNLAVPYVAEALHKNKSLKTLGIPSFEMISGDQTEYDDGDPVDVKTLSAMLEVNNTLTELEMSTTELTSDDVYILHDALRRSKTLKHLYLDHSVIKLTDPRMEAGAYRVRLQGPTIY